MAAAKARRHKTGLTLTMAVRRQSERDASLTAGRDTSTERRDLVLPLLAEGENQHLLIDVRILGQRSHRSATLAGEHLIGLPRLLIELRQRRDRGRLLAMYFKPELALESLMLFGGDINRVERAVL